MLPCRVEFGHRVVQDEFYRLVPPGEKPDRERQQGDGCDATPANPAIGVQMMVSIAGDLLLEVAGVIFIETLIHLAVIERVLDVCVQHQMLYGFIGIAGGQSPA